MAVSKETLVQLLPPYKDAWVKVKEKQRVPDIIKLICERHIDFASDYDIIGGYFAGATVEETCDYLYDFCCKNLSYKEEPEAVQTVGNPASILARGDSGIDCKSYALFIGGCLDALRRQGEKIDWEYRFASYDPLQKIPYHVFVIVNRPGQAALYVDPTPGANGKEPFWVTDRKVHIPKFQRVGLGISRIGTADTSNASYGVLMPAPAWYPSNLPLFYNNGNGFHLHGNAVAKYTLNDVLDLLLYYQTLVGYNRIDYSNAIPAAWYHTDNNDSGYNWAVKALGEGQMGDNWANVGRNNFGVDGALVAKLQQRYILNEAKAKPWLSAMQGKGGGIDLMTIPMGNDVEIPRPSWYASYLPSLFFAGGNPGQYASDHLDTKPKIANYKSSGFVQYTITPQDVAMYMVYAQPVINAGPTPYPLNWYINDDVNGAMASWFKVTTGILPQHTNAQMQTWGFTGNILQEPMLDANPFASGFTLTLQTVVSAAINYFAGKIPGGSKLVTAAYYAGNINGGSYISGSDGMPPGAFSAAVFKAADDLITKVAAAETTKKLLIIGLLAAVGLGWYYWDDIKKEI